MDGLSVAAVAVDAAGTVIYCNDASVSLFGSSESELRGAPLATTLFADTDRDAAQQVLTRALTGAAWNGDLRLTVAGGRAREMSTSWSPVNDGLRTTGVLLLAEDTHAGEPDEGTSPTAYARLLTRRLNRLAAVTADLLAATSVEGVARVVTDHMTDAAGATVGSISLLVDDDTLALIGVRGVTDAVASRWSTFPVTDSNPASEAVRTGKPVIVEGRAEMTARFPDLAGGSSEVSTACLPLLVAGRPLGAVTLAFPGRRRVDGPELLFLRLLADICAHAIDRIRAQEEAADREAKLAFLADASARLASDLDYESTLVAVAEAAVPWFADWCAIALEDDGRLRNLSVAHAQPDSAPLVAELEEKYPADPESGQGGYQVLRTGQSLLVPEVTDEMLVLAARDEAHLRLVRKLNLRSVLSCPLKVHDRVLGVVTWVAGESGRRFSADDLAFGEDLAHRAAVAIDNAQLHSQVRDVALQLQRAVLPERLPETPGWGTAVAYLPAGRTDAGGDFYDVVPLAGDRLALFVGDVMGRGVQAASVMAQMRSAIRTLVAIDPDPATVMSRLDDVFERLDLEHLVTLAYAVADRGRGTLDVINAGHPAPLLLRPGSEVAIVRADETMLLGAGRGTRGVVTLPYAPGDAVLLYTDGLIERRGEDTDTGMDRLIAAARGLGRSEDLTAALAAVVEEVRDPTRDDDVAALVVRREA
nr:SpoIIE family protein phosphatase [Nocardioides panaciterrulae]